MCFAIAQFSDLLMPGAEESRNRREARIEGFFLIRLGQHWIHYRFHNLTIAHPILHIMDFQGVILCALRSPFWEAC
jgi:hypothetical protein